MKHTDSYRKQGESSELSRRLDKLNYEDTFGKASAWLNGMSPERAKSKPERSISKMKEFFLTRKVRIVYAALALALVVAACNYPVSSNENAGDFLTWNVDPSHAGAADAIKRLPWISNGTMKVSSKETNGKNLLSYSFIIPKENHNNSASYKAELESIQGVSDVRLTELSQTVTRPVYSQVLRNLFNIDINATNMSDEELKSQIESQLHASGFTSAVVTIQHVGNSRRVGIELDDNSMPDNSGFDVKVTDGDNVERIKKIKKSAADPEALNKMTDDEIRQMVKNDHPEDNIQDNEIIIIREDGKVKIKIERVRED